MSNYIEISNNQAIAISEIPVLNYEDFRRIAISEIKNRNVHCVNYFAYNLKNQLKCICCLADDEKATIKVNSFILNDLEVELESLSQEYTGFHPFEREIHENFGVRFKNHPWLKPLRYSWNRADKQKDIANYPFYALSSEELHEVGVGPIHAGVIEPGHFRFICHGEQILHLEIQLGFQHRGVESLFLSKSKLNQRVTLSESICGDTVAGHASAFSYLWESLHNQTTTKELNFQRSIALELERIAIHTGDLAAFCTDIAYQLGNAVLGRLRTPIVNFMQEWCGNRLAKGLIRPFKSYYPFNEQLKQRLLSIFELYEKDYYEIWERIKTLPSAMSRFEKCGILTTDQMWEIGAVGMAAKQSGLQRDIRCSHPFGLFQQTQHNPVLKLHGDVYARARVRNEEIRQSIEYIKSWLNEELPTENENITQKPILPDTFAISLIEGWRGEICHCAVTDNDSNLLIYKVKDPSLHNWNALALAVRDNEISDFPVNNKSFNLSYCGFDL